MADKHTAELEKLTNNLKGEFQTFREERAIETKQTMSMIQTTIQEALNESLKVAASCEKVHDSGEKP